mgnify:CR=1 FL=1
MTGLRQKNLVRSSPVLLQEISVDSGISLFSLDYYTDSYGAQLDGNAKALYDLLVQNYVVDYSQYLDSVEFSF